MSERVVVYRWVEVKGHLELLLDSIHKKMEAADGPEMHRLQGEARCLRKLLNLPDTLTALKE
jgi:hypothetical protein